jgi:putative membrane protein
MKSILRNTLINAFALFLISQAISGIRISGGFESYLLAGFALSLLFLILKPILNIISIPLNIITLGFFSVVTNIIIYYLLTVFITSVTISDFTYPGFSYGGFIIPKIYINIFFSFLLISIMQSFIFSFIAWLMRK